MPPVRNRPRPPPPVVGATWGGLCVPCTYRPVLQCLAPANEGGACALPYCVQWQWSTSREGRGPHCEWCTRATKPVSSGWAAGGRAAADSAWCAQGGPPGSPVPA